MSSRSVFLAKEMFRELRRTGDFVLTGMVKEKSDDDTVVLLCSGGDGLEWTPVSEQLILGFDVLGDTLCDGQHYNVVTLRLSRPPTIEAEVFAHAKRRLVTTFDRPSSERLEGSDTKCTWDSLHNVWHCPPR